MFRRVFLVICLVFAAVGFGFSQLSPALKATVTAKLSDLVPISYGSATESRDADPWSASLIAAARAQIGVTMQYDGAYAQIAYPNGDVPMESGVCTDVVIRALRASHGLDLQQSVHEDMLRAFSSYPALWGSSGPDSNIDHRRVPNLRRYFERHGQSLPVSDRAEDYLPGDLVTWLFAPGKPHIGIVSDRTEARTGVPLILHNAGAGTREQGFLFAYPITGHYRLSPKPTGT